LNCQEKKAQGFSSTQPQPQVSKASQPTMPEKKEAIIPTPMSVSPQNTLDVIEKKMTSIATENQENKPIESATQPTEMPKLDPSTTKSAVPQKPEPSKEDKGFFSFGFGARSESPQPSGTVVPGKVLAFGSSFLNSASNLMSSAVQDESSKMTSTTQKASTSETSAKTALPPTYLKGSITSEKVPPNVDSKAPVTEKPKEEKTDEKQVQPATAEPEALVVAAVAPNAETKTCPLCKVDLNVGSQDTPNYNACTKCKNLVCNLCGFNPTPHQTEVREYYYW